VLEQDWQGSKEGNEDGIITETKKGVDSESKENRKECVEEERRQRTPDQHL